MTHPSLSLTLPLGICSMPSLYIAISLSLCLSVFGPMSVIKGDEWKTGGEQGVLSPEFYAVCDHHTISHGIHMRKAQ